jgi:integrase
MASTTLVLKEPKAQSESLIYLLVRFNNQRLKYSTGQKVHPLNWNEDKQKVKELRALPGAAEMNTLLKNHMDAAHDIYRTLVNDKQVPTVNKIKSGLDDIFKNPLKNGNPKEFIDFIDNFIKTSTKAPATIGQYKQTFKVIKDFQEKARYTLNFDSIDMEFYDKFITFQANQGYYMNTIATVIKNLKVFMNEALDKGLTKNVAFKSRKFKKVEEESESIYLTKAEITKIFELDLSATPELIKARDLFIIGCYTGLRFSDLSKLNEKNLIDNNTKIRILTQKTAELVIIPLHTYILDILKRYDGKIPEVINNQKMNNALKDIGKLAGLDENVTLHFTKGGVKKAETFPKHELITVHTARRSFATNAYLNDIPSISIMKITGHRTEKAFLKYIKITQEENATKLLSHPFFI